jgi:hypothetical protein
MLLPKLLTAVLALATPAPSPSPPPTIITIVSSPYCKSLAEHFNDALVPMLANDRTLDGVSVSLDNFNTMFQGPNYVQVFLQSRDALGKQETELNRSLAEIQLQINLLREGARLSDDPKAQAQIHQAAQELQTAYDHQRQLAIDTQNLYESLLRYNINRLHPTLGGFDWQDMTAPADARDVKSYLRFNGQRDVIATSEDKAADVALATAQSYCVQSK